MRIMGLDLGERTIGIAVSDPLLLTAQGLTVLRRRSPAEDLQELADIKDEYSIKEVVIGLPRMMDGSIGPRGRISQEFAQSLRKRWEIPVHLWDERLSTVAAERILLEADLSRRRRKNLIDKTAAVLILQGFLERRRNEKIREGLADDE